MSEHTKREEADIVLSEIYDKYKGKSAKDNCDSSNIPIRMVGKQTTGTAFLGWEKSCDCTGPYSFKCHGQYIIKLVPSHKLDCELWSDFLIFHELGHFYLQVRDLDKFRICSNFDYWQLEISCDIFAIMMLFSSLGSEIIDLKNTVMYFSNLGKTVEDEEEQKEVVRFFKYFTTQKSGSP